MPRAKKTPAGDPHKKFTTGRKKVDLAPVDLPDIEANRHLPFKEWAPRFLRLRDIHGNIVPFVLNDIQLLLDEEWERQLTERGQVKMRILKPRKVGTSTWAQGKMLRAVVERPGWHAGVMAHDDTGCDFVFDRTKVFHDNLPVELKRMLVRNNKKELAYKEPHGSFLRVNVAKPRGGWGSGGDIHMMHFSERSKWLTARGTSKAQGQVAAVLSAMPNAVDGCAVVDESTAMGKANAFYDAWCDSKPNEIAGTRWGKDGFVRMFFPWYQHKDYRIKGKVREDFFAEKEWAAEEMNLWRQGVDEEQLAWRRWYIAEKCGADLSTFHQEMPSCVAAHIRVSTELGIIRIDAAEKADESESGKIVGWIQKGVAPVVKITTLNGYSVTVTPDHRVGLNGGGFCEARDILGKSVALCAPRFASEVHRVAWRELPSIESSVLIDERMALFLGYFMGDGCWGGTTGLSISCTGKDVDVVNEVRDLITEHIGVPHGRVIGNRDGGYEWRKASKRFEPFLRAIGAVRERSSDGKVIRNVCVPECIFRSPQPIVRAFLQGVFEADGYTDHRQSRILFFSQYHAFIDDIQVLLLGFGITSRRGNVVKRSGTGAEYVGHELRLRVREAEEFHKLIGFRSKRKNDCYRPYKVNKHTVGRPAANIMLYDEVVSVEAAGEAAVFDLSIASSEHTFSAGGIVVHNCDEEAFLASGESPFDNAQLATMYTELDKRERNPATATKRWRIDNDGTPREERFGELRFWHRRGHAELKKDDIERYVIVADPSGSGAKDPCCAYVWDRQYDEQIAELHGNWQPAHFGDLLYSLGVLYNNPLMIVEAGPWGGHVIAHLQRKDYPRLYHREALDQDRQTPDTDYGRHGWVTTGANKPRVIAALKQMWSERRIKVNSLDCISEHLTYVKNGTKYEAQSGRHDDRVMCCAIYSMWALEHPYEPKREAPKEVPVAWETNLDYGGVDKDKQRRGAWVLF